MVTSGNANSLPVLSRLRKAIGLKSVGLKMATVFGLAIVLLGGIGAASYVSTQRLIETNRRVDHTQRVIQTASEVLSLLKDAESSNRSFVITGEEQYLEPYRNAQASLPREMAQLRRLAADSPHQRSRLDRIEGLIQIRMERLQRGIDLRRGPGGLAAATAVIKSGRGKQVMDDIRRTIREIQDEETALLAAWSQEAEASAAHTVALIAVGVPLTCLLLVAAALVITRNIARPLALVTAAAERISSGDLDVSLPVTDRTDEIGALRRSFVAMTVWLDRMAAVADKIAEGDLNVAIQPLSNRDRLGNSLATMIANLRRMTSELAEGTRAMRLSEQLKRSNEDLEQFAYVASHDLQEPLRMITGYLDMLQEEYKGRLDKEADRYIAFATDGARRMQELINDLLAYSRVSTRGGLPRPMSLAKAFEKAVGDHEETIRQTGARVTHDDLPIIPADPTQMRQLLSNLIGNALKYRAPGLQPQVHVNARLEGDHWLFSVRDNGIGIDPTYATEIFQLFRRLHPREEYAGTGIGLAICKKIVERHGGRIWVESREGEGATFCFTLPAQGQEVDSL